MESHECDEWQTLLSSSDLVRYICCDLNGLARGHVIPSSALLSHPATRTGLSTYCGILACGLQGEPPLTIPELNRINHGNVLLVPHPHTALDAAWSKAGSRGVRVKQMLSEVCWSDGTPMKACPRFVARQVVKRLYSERGWSVKAGFESEFCVYEPQSLQPLFPGTKLMSHLENCHHEEFLHQVCKSLPNVCHYLKTEYFAGQLELPLLPMYGVKAADDMFLLRSLISEMCQDSGDRRATFMTCPYRDEEANSGCHFNHSLWLVDGSVDSGWKSVFYDSEQKNNLTPEAMSWLAGILHHLPALTALCCPTINCYQRLHRPWAPGKLNWGVDDRTVTVRVKNMDEAGTFFENRLPSSACNPYLVLAATLAAGMDGVEKEMSVSEVDPDQDLPTSLADALECLEGDAALFKKYMGSEVIDWFVEMKRETEVKPLAVKSEDEQHAYYFTAI